jgi:hypothetical protein
MKLDLLGNRGIALNAIKNLGAHCAEVLNGGASGHGLADLTAIAHAAQIVAVDSSSSYELSLNDLTGGNIQNSDGLASINSWFQSNVAPIADAAATRATTEDGKPVGGFILFRSTTSLWLDPNLMVHELLHLQYGSHSNIAEKFGIPSYLAATEESGSSGITSWLRNGCQSSPQQP